MEIIEEDKFYSILEEELDIFYSYPQIEDKSLLELHLTRPEIDLFLNRIEAAFNVIIYEGKIDMEISFAELVEILRYRSRPQTNEDIFQNKKISMILNESYI